MHWIGIKQLSVEEKPKKFHSYNDLSVLRRHYLLSVNPSKRKGMEGKGNTAEPEQEPSIEPSNSIAQLHMAHPKQFYVIMSNFILPLRIHNKHYTWHLVFWVDLDQSHYSHLLSDAGKLIHSTGPQPYCCTAIETETLTLDGVRHFVNLTPIANYAFS